MNVAEFIKIAEQLGLPCIQRHGFLSVVGLDQVIVFKVEGNFIILEEI